MDLVGRIGHGRERIGRGIRQPHWRVPARESPAAVVEPVARTAVVDEVGAAAVVCEGIGSVLKVRVRDRFAAEVGLRRSGLVRVVQGIVGQQLDIIAKHDPGSPGPSKSN